MAAFGILQTMADVSDPGSTFQWQNPRWSAEWCIADIVNADGAFLMAIAMQLIEPPFETFNQNGFEKGSFRVIEKSCVPGAERFCILELEGTSRPNLVRFRWFLDGRK